MSGKQHALHHMYTTPCQPSPLLPPPATDIQHHHHTALCLPQAEMYDPELYEFGLSMAHDLDARFGLPKKTMMSQVQSWG